MDTRDIVQEAGMSARPEYYSGRGATLSDLNYTILTRIAEMISRHHGGEAKKNFVRMVASMKKLSATDFLLSLYRLEGNNWNYIHPYDAQDICAGDTATGFGTIASVLSGMNRTDETLAIRRRFLQENSIDTEERTL